MMTFTSSQFAISTEHECLTLLFSHRVLSNRRTLKPHRHNNAGFQSFITISLSPSPFYSLLPSSSLSLFLPSLELTLFLSIFHFGSSLLFGLFLFYLSVFLLSLLFPLASLYTRRNCSGGHKFFGKPVCFNGKSISPTLVRAPLKI